MGGLWNLELSSHGRSLVCRVQGIYGLGESKEIGVRV